MAWIESHQGLANHPKTKRLVRRLNISTPLAVGHLHCLWWWALDFAQDGEISQYDAFDIADACQWQGDPEQLFESLIDAGFIDVADDKRFLHDWYDYAGKLIEIRRKDAERKRNSRGNPKMSSGHPADIQRTSDGVRAESIRDLNQDLNTTTTTSGDPETVTDAHQRVFGTLSMNGLMQGYIMQLKNKGFTDRFIIELMLETGESATKPSLRLMQAIGERWEREKIYTRLEAKARKIQSAQPVPLPVKPQRVVEEPVYEPKVVI